MPAIVALAAVHVVDGRVWAALERMDLILWAKLSVVLYVVLAVFFVRGWGAVGMALATGTALLAKNLAVYWLTPRAGGIRMPWDAIRHIVMNVALTAGLLLAIRTVAGDGWLGIVTGVGAGLLFYAILTFFNSGYPVFELTLFADLLPSRIRGSRPARRLWGGLLHRAEMAVQPTGAGSR